MASLGLIESKIQGLPTNIRPVVLEIFRAFLKDLRLGHPEDQEPSENFGGHFYEGTTASVANVEFTIAHGFGRKPYLLLPVLPLDVAGAKLVPLKVERVADTKRIFLSSSVTSAPITVLLEG